MKIAVGSKNPVKIEAVRQVFGEVFDEKIEVVGVGVESGVGDQPRSDGETIRGATARAKRALKIKVAEYGVGLEGGVFEIENKMYECAWCVVVGPGGREGLGGGMRFEIPEKVAEKIRAGGELGPIMDEFLGRSNVKQEEGAIGVLTKKHVTRQKAYEGIIYYALVKFVSSEWYDKS